MVWVWAIVGVIVLVAAFIIVVSDGKEYKGGFVSEPKPTIETLKLHIIDFREGNSRRHHVRCDHCGHIEWMNFPRNNVFCPKCLMFADGNVMIAEWAMVCKKDSH